MLEFHDATKIYGTLRALDACTFAARPGRLTGFLGPNGAGKTTAMRAVFGLVELDSGSVTWNGNTILAADRAKVRLHARRTWPVPTHAGPRATRLSRPAVRQLADGGGSQRATAGSIDSDLAGRGRDRLDALSHGNQQRVQLIAALVNDPELLVLDEPFSGLDPIAITNMSAVLAEVAAAGATVLFSSHQLDLVEHLCEDVVIIDHGRIVRAGDLAEIRASSAAAVRRRSLPRAPPRTGRHCRAPSSCSRTTGTPDSPSSVTRTSPPSPLSSSATAKSISFSYQPPTLSELFRQAVAA